MPVSFVVYIDESGDTGLEQIKKAGDPKGATEWLVLSAFLVRIQNDSKMVSWTQDVQAKFTSKRSDLHFNKLLPFKKTLVCSALAMKPAKGFVVMSNKKNIEKYKKPMPMLFEMNLTEAQKHIFNAYGANANSWKKK